MKITKEDIQRRESALATLLETMYVPAMRRDTTAMRNVRWLNRNLRIDNGSHPMVESALELATFLMKHKK